MNALLIAFRTLAREWKSGELGVLILAITVAVAALTGVGFLVDRIGAAIDNQAGEVLAADVVLESGQVMDDRAIEEGRRRGLATARKTGMFSVVFNGDASQLSSLRAVSAGYPLRGKVLLSNEPFGASQVASGIPGRGEVWPESRLAAAIGATVGSELAIGSSKFRVAQILISRPDQGATFLELAPSLIMNDEDLAATQLVQPGSRMRRAQLFAGERAAVAAFKEWLEKNKKPNEEIEDVEDSAPQIKSAIDRSARFLSISSLVAVLLCAIAVAMAARRYVQRHLDSVALMKTLGATRNFTLLVSLSQLVLIGLIAAVIGSLIGFGAQAWLVKVLSGWLRGDLPPPGLAPLGMGFLTAVGPGWLRAAAAAAAVAHAGAAGTAPRCGTTGAHGDPGIRARRARDRIPHLLGDPRPQDLRGLRPGTHRLRAAGCRLRLAAGQANYQAAAWRRRLMALRHREPRTPPHRKRGAADRLRARHHDAAAARRGA